MRPNFQLRALLRRSHLDSGHTAALFRAVFASLSASLTVIILVLTAFGCTGVANVGAETANLMDKLRTTAHKCSGAPTDFCAVFIQPDTLNHHFHIALIQTRVRAVLASGTSQQKSSSVNFLSL
jgi:hypothetical protein